MATLPPGSAHPTGVPRVGDVYWLDTGCYGHDKKPTRPAVVIRAAVPSLLDEVAVLVRTSMGEFGTRHVKHPMDLSLGLDRDGIFPKVYRRLIDVRFFSMANFACFQGQLSEPYMSDILEMMDLI